MASENLDKRFELIQETFSNPEFKTKLGRILSEMTPSELAFVIESCLLYTSPSPRDEL